MTRIVPMTRTHTKPSRRAKLTRRWKRVRVQARNPRTRAALRTYIKREVGAAIAPLMAKQDWAGQRAACARAVHEFLAGIETAEERPLAFDPCDGLNTPEEWEQGKFTLRVISMQGFVPPEPTT